MNNENGNGSQNSRKSGQISEYVSNGKVTEAYSGTLSRPKSPKVALSRLKSPKVALSRLCRAML